MHTAIQSGTIVSSLFPKAVRDRMYNESEAKEKEAVVSSRLKSYLNDGSQMRQAVDLSSSDPIADLFHNTTVVFADIVGFTACGAHSENRLRSSNCSRDYL
jgi:hypothetical protein